MTGRPPRGAEFLLLRLLDDDAREAVAGDLEEEYQRRRQRRGRFLAGWHYRAQALRSIVTCRVTGRRRHDERPADFGADRGSLRDLLRPALRQFRDQPLYATTCVGTLALAVAVACGSAAVVRRALVDPLPYADDARLVSLLTLVDGDTSAVSVHVLNDLLASDAPLDRTAAVRPVTAAYRGTDATESVRGNAVTADYFRLLGIAPALGRVPGGHEPGTVVIGWGFWQRALAADPDVIGRTLVLDGQAHSVIGVLPQGLVPPYWPLAEVWLPLDLQPLVADPARGRRTLTVLARRAAGASAADVDVFLAHFSAQLAERYPTVHGGQSTVARPLRDELVGASRPALLATAAAALLLLAVVATNIAGLAAARAVAARRETAVRAALGATRARLFRQHAVDAGVIALLGSTIGVAMAYVLVRVLAESQNLFLDRLPPVALTPVGALAGLAGGLVIGVGAALVPRALASRVSDVAGLHGSRGGSADAAVTAGRLGLVVAQVALAFVMVAGAGLLIRTVQHLATLPLGFDPDRLAIVSVLLPGERYAESEPQIEFERAVLERLDAIPGVTSASASVGFPVIGGMFAGVAVRGRPADRELEDIAYFSIAPDFVAAVEMRLLSGRGLLPSDDASATPVVLINETMARRFWPGGDALGAQVRIGPGTDSPWITVIGIVADVRQHGPTAEVRPTAFGSTHQYSWPRRTFTFRVDGPRLDVTMAVRAAIRAVDPTLAVGAITPVDQLVSERTARHRLVMRALSLFGVVALVLCASGLYAVVALSSRVRRREYAIRIALGATGGKVRWLVLRQAVALAVGGTGVGLAVAASGTRVIAGMLHGVAPLDAGTFVLAAAGLCLLAVIAAWLPARLAGRVDPAEALQTD